MIAPPIASIYIELSDASKGGWTQELHPLNAGSLQAMLMEYERSLPRAAGFPAAPRPPASLAAGRGARDERSPRSGAGLAAWRAREPGLLPPPQAPAGGPRQRAPELRRRARRLLQARPRSARGSVR